MELGYVTEQRRGKVFGHGIRWLMTQSTPARPWEESPEAFGRRLKEAFAYINANYNVDSLSRELPQRVQSLVELKGDRLRK